MPADGYLNFNTKIDTDGFESGVKDVESHTKSFDSALSSLGKKIEAAFNVASVTAFGDALVEAATDVKTVNLQFKQTLGEMQSAAQTAIDRVASSTAALTSGVKNVDSGVKNAKNHVKSFDSALGKLGKTIKAAFSVAAVTAFGKALVEAAADVKAAGAQFEQTFGDMQDAANAAIKRVAEPADILAERLRGSATQIFAFAKTAKMESTTALKFMEDALQVAADSAAYYDRSIEDTTATLQSFLKGNYANDAALGLSATETTRNAKAMELYGKKFQDLSEAQKQLTLLEMVKEANELSGAMGQAAREAEGWENVTGNLSTAWNKFLGVVGQPVLQLAVPVIQQITTALEKLTATAQTAYSAMAKVFGWSDEQAKTVEQTAEAQEQVTQAVEETEEAQEGSLASFDEIEILASNTAEATEQTADATAQSVATTAETESTPNEQQTADTTWVDTFVVKLSEIKDFIDNVVKPAISTIGAAFELVVSEISDWIDTKLKPKLAEIGEKYNISFDAVVPDGIGDFFNSLGSWFTETLPGLIETVGDTFLGMLDPLGSWFTESFPDFFESGVELASTVVGGLLDTFSIVFGDIWESVIDPFWTTFTERMLPTFTELGTQMSGALTVAFEEVKKTFDSVWETGIKPVLDFIGKAWSDLWELIQEKWKQWGEPIFENLKKAFKSTGEQIGEIWETTLKPIWDTFMSTLDKLWQEHVLPLIASVMEFIGKLVNGALTIYNEFILPIVSYLNGILGPIFAAIFSTIIDVLGSFLGGAIDTAQGVIDWLGEIINFVVGVFTGDLDEALDAIRNIAEIMWEGLKNTFKNMVNVIISLINGLISGVQSMINSVANKINGMISSINSFLEAVGMPTIDFRIPTVTLPRVPALAEGAVIPPNREFLAVLGDQTSGTNIETPLDTMLEAFRTALRENGGGRGSQTVILMLDKRELGRAVIEAGNEETRRIGIRLVEA